MGSESGLLSPPQGISPGLVRTEFRGRSQRVEDVEASKKAYDDICEVRVLCLLSLFVAATSKALFAKQWHCGLSVWSAAVCAGGAGGRGHCSCSVVCSVSTA